VSDSPAYWRSKQELKLAIKILLLVYVSNKDYVNAGRLKQHYISIASFQKLDLKDKAAFAKAKDSVNNDSGTVPEYMYPSYLKYLDKVFNEQTALSGDS
jgi:hypothetical protein